jgi:hypothetical protein
MFIFSFHTKYVHYEEFNSVSVEVHLHEENFAYM